MCVKIADLLHDIGHGPNSHIYDGLFRKQLGRAEARGLWMGHAFERMLIINEMDWRDSIDEALDGDDTIVEKNQIHHGMKDMNREFH